MERIVNYSSEDEYEDSPKRNAAERCPVLEIDPNKRNKGDSSSRHPKEESTRDRSQGSSFHRDNKEASQNVLRKNSHKEENRNSRPSSSKDQHYHRDDRRPERSHEKKRNSKDDRRRKDSHRERDRDHEHRDLDRDRRDRSDKHRRERFAKDNSHREKGRRRRSSDSPTPSSKDHNTSSSRIRNRSRSRSPSKEQRIIPSIPPVGGRQQKEEPTASTSVSQNKSAINLQAVLIPPLSNEASKSAIVINKSDGTPIALPTYYNPNIINPTKYAEQVQKRKLIWGAKKAEDTSAKWGHATFSEDSDGKVASKFMRLMGIKSTPKPGDSPADVPPPEKKGPDVKSRQAMFSNMEQQYEVARQVTHTMRGVGLGFGSQSRQY